MMWAAQQNRDMHSVSDLIQETATTARGWRNFNDRNFVLCTIAHLLLVIFNV
jgi:hypothetical protein